MLLHQSAETKFSPEMNYFAYQFTNSIRYYQKKQEYNRILARKGVYAPDGPAFLAHTKQKVSNIADLTVLRLPFFMGNE